MSKEKPIKIQQKEYTDKLLFELPKISREQIPYIVKEMYPGGLNIITIRNWCTARIVEGIYKGYFLDNDVNRPGKPVCKTTYDRELEKLLKRKGATRDWWPLSNGYCQSKIVSPKTIKTINDYEQLQIHENVENNKVDKPNAVKLSGYVEYIIEGNTEEEITGKLGRITYNLLIHNSVTLNNLKLEPININRL